MVSDTSKIISGACFSGACFSCRSAVLEVALGTLLRFSQETYEVRCGGNGSGSFPRETCEVKHGENGFDQVGRARKPVTGMRKLGDYAELGSGVWVPFSLEAGLFPGIGEIGEMLNCSCKSRNSGDCNGKIGELNMGNSPGIVAGESMRVVKGPGAGAVEGAELLRGLELRELVSQALQALSRRPSICSGSKTTPAVLTRCPNE